MAEPDTEKSIQEGPKGKEFIEFKELHRTDMTRQYWKQQRGKKVKAMG